MTNRAKQNRRARRSVRMKIFRMFGKSVLAVSCLTVAAGVCGDVGVGENDAARRLQLDFRFGGCAVDRLSIRGSLPNTISMSS